MSARGPRAISSSRCNRTSPDTTILVDEAYFDYVTDPDHDTHIPLAVEDPRVIVARTFSKAYGMAGLRMGYCVGHPETIRKMADWDSASGTSSLNVLAMQAGVAAIEQDPSFITAERDRNKAVRELDDEVVLRPRHEADRLAGQLHVREHRPSGEGLPRRVQDARTSSSRATSRRSRRRTAASRSGRWKR